MISESELRNNEYKRTQQIEKPRKVETIEEYLARGGRINGGPCPHPDAPPRPITGRTPPVPVPESTKE